MLRSVEVSARLQGTREEYYAILADCGRYSQWAPGIEMSSVLATEGDVTIAELRGRLFSDRTLNLELIYSRPDGVTFHQIDCLGRPEISGRLRVEETEAGIGSPTVLVRFAARIETPLLEFGSGRRARSALRAGLDSLGARRRHLASARPVAADSKQKVLEVVREAGGLRIWYLGESFLLPRQDAGS